MSFLPKNRVILTLEDCGVVSPPPPQPEPVVETGKIAIPTPEMIEEVAKWKKEEKEKWRKKIKEQEQSLKSQWDLELKKKREEQEAMFAKRTAEIIQLQERLRATLQDLERRDQVILTSC